MADGCAGSSAAAFPEMPSRRFLLGTSAATAGLAAMALVLFLRPPARGAADAYRLPSPLPAPDFELTSDAGTPLRLGDLSQDGLVVLFFGYTHCPDLCPTTLADLTRARGQLGREADRVRILLVTVDPARDDPAQLADYVRRFGPGITGLTGSAEALRRVAADYLAFAEPAPVMPGMAPGAVLFDHTARSFVVKGRQVLMTFPPQTPVADIATGLSILLRED